jgi:hypothetical protein
MIKKLYYRRESTLLKRYEKNIAAKAVFLSVTEKDAETYRRIFNCKSVQHLPLFLPSWKVIATSGMGGYCLYQGDLSVDANVTIVEWMVKKIFSGIDVSLKIAGKRPPASLKKTGRCLPEYYFDR